MVFQLIDRGDRPGSYAGRLVMLPFILGGFLVGAYYGRQYALVGAIVGAAVMVDLYLYGDRLTPKIAPPSFSDRLDALLARNEDDGGPANEPERP